MRRGYRGDRGVSLAVLAAALLGTGQAQAQMPVEDTVDATLKEIVVTAQRREESLQDTPLSVTALDALDLETRNVRAFEDLERVAPNISITTGSAVTSGSSLPTIYIRGIGQNDPTIASDPGVGIYVDGVYVARSPGSVLDLPDIRSVEVLRGPQGTLFGKNATAGAINISTLRPTSGFTAFGSVSVGNFDLREVQGVVSGELTPKLSAKVAGLLRRQDGYGEILDQATGEKRGELGGIHRSAVRGELAWSPTDNFDLRLSGDYSKIKDDPQPRRVRFASTTAGLVPAYNNLVGIPQGTPFLPSAQTEDPDDSFGLGPTGVNEEVWGLSANAELAIGAATLRSITAYRRLNGRYAYDIDATAATFADQLADLDQKQFSQEVQLFGKAFDDRLDWIAGVYYLSERAKQFTGSDVLGGIYDALESLPGPIIPLSPAPCPTFCLGGAGNPLNVMLDNSFDFDLAQDTDSYAAYAQASYEVMPTVSLIAGLRWTRDEKTSELEVVKRQSGVIAVPRTQKKGTWEALTPRLGVQWKPNQDLLFYATFSEGFKSGGFNGLAFSPQGYSEFKPETVRNYEVGFKSTLAERRVRLNGAGFWTTYDDIQLNRTVSDPASGNFYRETANIAGARIAGIELEADLIPFAGSLLNVSVSWLDNKYTELQPGAPVTADDVLPDAPRWTIRVGGEHRFELGSVSVTPRLDYSWRSKVYEDAENTETIASDAAGFLSGRLTIEQVAGPFSLALWGRNLTDKRAIVFGQSQAVNGITVVQFTRPREFGLTLSAKF